MSLNQTDIYGDLYEKVPTVLLVMMRTTALSIMFLNVSVVLCLVCKKHKLPRIYTLQMICLSGSDITAGMAVLIVSLIDQDWFRECVVRCSFALGFFIASQSTTLYNVMAICINRFVILIRADTPVHHLTTARVVVFSVAAVCVSFCFCALPFIRWASDQATFSNTGCSMESVFRENMESAMKVFFATFMIPLMITNCLYGCLCLILRKRQRQIQPRDQSTSEQVSAATKRVVKLKHGVGNTRPRQSKCHSISPIPGPSINSSEMKIMTNRGKPLAWTHVGNGKQTQGSPGNSLDSKLLKDNSCNKTWLQTDNVDKIVELGPQNSNVDKQQAKPEVPPSPTEANATRPERRGHQRKAFALLGLILLFLNIFTWPGVIVLLMETSMDSWSLSRPVKFPLFCTISLNSIVNPILYTIRLPEFRKILSHIFLCQPSHV